MIGRPTIRSPFTQWSSEWHRPEAASRTRTSPSRGAVELDLLDAPRLVEAPQNCRFSLHDYSLSQLGDGSFRARSDEPPRVALAHERSAGTSGRSTTPSPESSRSKTSGHTTAHRPCPWHRSASISTRNDYPRVSNRRTSVTQRSLKPNIIWKSRSTELRPPIRCGRLVASRRRSARRCTPPARPDGCAPRAADAAASNSAPESITVTTSHTDRTRSRLCSTSRMRDSPVGRRGPGSGRPAHPRLDVVEARRRLVEEQDRRLAGDRPGDRDPCGAARTRAGRA